MAHVGGTSGTGIHTGNGARNTRLSGRGSGSIVRRSRNIRTAPHQLTVHNH